MSTPLRVLLVEDSDDDARLVIRQLRDGGHEVTWERVETAEAMTAALDGKPWDVVICDYQLPHFSGPAALKLLQDRGEDLPFIVVSGTIGEDVAVTMMKAGAHDYLLKGNLTRLVAAVERELGDAAGRRERRRVEADLHASEIRFRRLFESARDGILVVNARNGIVVDVNPVLLEWTGTSRDQLIGRKVWELDCCRAIVADRAEFLQLRERGEVHFDDRPLTGADGSRIDVEFVGSVYAVGSHLVMQCNLRDIRHRKQTVAALQNSERYFRALTDHSLDIVSVIDAAGIIRFESASIEQVLGWKPEELVGQDAFDRVHPDDLGKVRTLFETKAPEAGAAGTVEIRYRHKDGSWRVLEANGCNLIHDPAVGGIVVNSRDITDRQQAEEALRKERDMFNCLAATVPDLIYFKDRRSRFVRINDAMVRHYELRTAADAVGKTDFDFFTRLHAQQTYDDEQRVMCTGEPAVGLEERETWPDGRITWSSSTKVPWRDAAGNIIGLIGISRDITERKLLEEKFLRAQRLESLGMLAAGIAHDLNNVLSPVGMAASLLRSRTFAPGDLRLLDTLEKCAERGAGLVKQILGFAHGVGGEPRLVQVKHLLRDIVQVVTETFPKSIVLEDCVPNDLWPVLANPTQIHQVLLNLCVNARDAMPQGGMLRLRAENRVLGAAAIQGIDGGRPGAWLALEVEDSGTGIPPELLPRIWEPFFTTKSADKGTGLGLSTVRGIVAAHRGWITLETAAGRGTKFTVFLPAETSAVSGDKRASARAIVPGATELVLLVDDEALIRETAHVILNSAGYRVVLAADGGEALELFQPRAAEFALVITDLDMPRMGGEELARSIATVRPGLPILAISGLASRDYHARAPEFASALLVKPFTAQTLLQEVQRLLHPPVQSR